MRAAALFVTTSLIAATTGAAHADDAGAIFDANQKAMGGAAWANKAALDVQYAYVGQGLTGTVGSRYDLRSGAFADTQDLGPNQGANGFDGREAWMRDVSGAVTPQAGGDIRQLAVNEAYRDANLWWRADRGGADIRNLGDKTEDGRTFDVLSVAPKGGKPFQAWFDAKTHLLARTIEPQGSQTITTFMSDYRPTDGALLAGKLMIDDGTGVQYRQSETLTTARLLPAQPASAYAAPHITLADASIQNAAGRTSIPFKLLNNHIYAEVMVNGKGPFLCIFDTGGHDLLTPATAKALAVRSEGQSPGTGAGEAVVEVGFARGVSFRIGDLTIKDQTIFVIPFEAPEVEGFDEQAMVGFEVFRRFVTQIDYGSKTLTFIDPAKFDPKDAGTPVPFVFYNSNPEVQGTFEGISGRFNIDTGARDELTLTKPFVDANGLVSKHPKGVTAVDGWGVGGPATSYVTRGADFTLGTVKIGPVVAGLANQPKGAFSDPNYEGNVGSGLLKRFVVTFDYDHQIMYLKPLPAPVPDIGVFDRAGFWINTSAKGFKIVDLTATGAAAAAGLKTNDEITMIDGVPAASIPISDLRQRLRDLAPGTVVKLNVESGGQARTVTLTLKDQI